MNYFTLELHCKLLTKRDCQWSEFKAKVTDKQNKAVIYMINIYLANLLKIPRTIGYWWHKYCSSKFLSFHSYVSTTHYWILNKKSFFLCWVLCISWILIRKNCLASIFFFPCSFVMNQWEQNRSEDDKKKMIKGNHEVLEIEKQRTKVLVEQ